MNIYAANVSDWAKSELDEADSCGLIPESFADEDFTQSVTRVEFASIAVRLYEKMTGEHIEKTDENPFVDIEQTEYKNEIIKAYRLGITLGTYDDVFEPQQNISREQMATMLCRTIKAAKFDTWSIYCDSAYVMDVDDAVKFNDDADISEYAVNSVLQLKRFVC